MRRECDACERPAKYYCSACEGYYCEEDALDFHTLRELDELEIEDKMNET
jgi:hypothetical protein